MILAFDFACAKVAWFGSTFFSHICSKMLKSFLTRLIHGKSSKHGSTRDNIAQGNFVEHSPSILHAPQIWHECQQDYFSQRYLTQNHFEQCFEWSAHQHTWPLLSATAMAQHSALPQTWKGFGCTLSCRICCNTWTAICLCLQLTYSNIITLQETISHKGVLLNTVQASSMLKFLHTKVTP